MNPDMERELPGRMSRALDGVAAAVADPVRARR